MIVAFGDSLTKGLGAREDFSYPKQIEKKTGIKVINAGINEEYSAGGLLRLPSLLEKKPALVILCHGGNDIVNQTSFSVLKSNLLEMIKLIQESKTKILFVGLPDYYHSGFGMCDIYTEVAEETGVLFECDVLRHVDLDRSLKSDHVHPNEKGYEKIADAFISILEI
ncbi:arylesterase [Sulfurimonas sp. SAG-AH-194-I05]|nr:GDSL-type esterase/lipase family protein [Sulfurimonas sp. SAG-AH-194-I05]MDF1875004.1 arylesterase [Sulfurimonas sp. SAG-AH-194-I05]